MRPSLDKYGTEKFYDKIRVYLSMTRSCVPGQIAHTRPPCAAVEKEKENSTCTRENQNGVAGWCSYRINLSSRPVSWPFLARFATITSHSPYPAPRPRSTRITTTQVDTKRAGYTPFARTLDGCNWCINVSWEFFRSCDVCRFTGERPWQ
jgi:hypothetical protein